MNEAAMTAMKYTKTVGSGAADTKTMAANTRPPFHHSTSRIHSRTSPVHPCWVETARKRATTTNDTIRTPSRRRNARDVKSARWSSQKIRQWPNRDPSSTALTQSEEKEEEEEKVEDDRRGDSRCSTEMVEEKSSKSGLWWVDGGWTSEVKVVSSDHVDVPEPVGEDVIAVCIAGLSRLDVVLCG